MIWPTSRGASLRGKVCVLSVAPSLDTPVCATQTRTFNKEASDLSQDVAILSVSLDLPFALKRFCGAEGIDRVTTASDYKHRTFGEAFGVYLKELGLLSRAIFVVDRDGKVAPRRVRARGDAGAQLRGGAGSGQGRSLSGPGSVPQIEKLLSGDGVFRCAHPLPGVESQNTIHRSLEHRHARLACRSHHRAATRFRRRGEVADLPAWDAAGGRRDRVRQGPAVSHVPTPTRRMATPIPFLLARRA